MALSKERAIEISGVKFEMHANSLSTSASDCLPISVIVVNHNGGALLVRCVEIALRSARQVIVVDNNSSDSSMQLLAEKFSKATQLKVITSSVNRGFAAGCNLGGRIATEEYWLYLNPDCILGEHSAQLMFRALVSNPSVGMVGGLLTNLDGSEQGGARRAVPTPWRSFVRAFGLSVLSKRWPKIFFNFYLNKEPLPAKAIEVEAISGALMLVRRSAMLVVGLWDEEYFLHCEDLDLCMRFRQADWQILFVPDAPVLHYLGQSSKSRPYFVEWHKHKGMIRFYQKFFSHQYPWGLMWLVRLGVWFRFSLIVIRYAFRRTLSRMGGEHEKG